ncbi:MAG: hypothetical protein IK076_07620 [Bacteroidales bacterium]|nr:hypothetical protein [Bacteroidales bacterium]
MKKTTTIALTAILILFCTGLSAQDNNRNNWGDRIKAEKIAFFTDAMNLTPAEAEKFWPVYNQAEAEKFESWKLVMNAQKSLMDGMKAGKDEKELAGLIDKFLESQKNGKDIDSKYVKEYRKILSNEKIAKLYLAEENFRRMQIHKLNKNDDGKNDKK